jgi:hypothetical protein
MTRRLHISKRTLVKAVLAFGIAALLGTAFGLFVLDGDEDSDQRLPAGLVKLQQARGIPLRTPKETVLRRLGQPLRLPRGPLAPELRGGTRDCIFYAARDQPGTLLRMCFKRGTLRDNGTVVYRFPNERYKAPRQP